MSSFIPDYQCRGKQPRPAAPDCDNFCARVFRCITGAVIYRWLKVVCGSNLKIWFDAKTGYIYFDEDLPPDVNMVKTTVQRQDYRKDRPTTWKNQPTQTEWRHLDQLEGQYVQIETIAGLPLTGDSEKLYYVSEDISLRVWDVWRNGYIIVSKGQI